MVKFCEVRNAVGEAAMSMLYDQTTSGLNVAIPLGVAIAEVEDKIIQKLWPTCNRYHAALTCSIEVIRL